jgi:hypothetical protein
MAAANGGNRARPDCGADAAIRDSYREAATPLIRSLYLRFCPAFVTRNASSMIHRGRRRTDEASQSQKDGPIAEHPGFKVVASSRLWLSETSLRALARRWDRFLHET